MGRETGMRPKIGIVSIGITSRAIANALRKTDLPADFEFHELLLNQASLLPESIEACDVLVSSGNNAKILREKTEKPVISISPSLYDILQACGKAIDYTPAPVVVMHRDAYQPDDLKNIAKILLLEIICKCYDQADSTIEDIILELKRQGHACVVGSGLVCQYAEKNGLRGIYLFPEESIRTCLGTAADLAISICQKNSQNLRLASIINHSQRGIILVSGDGLVLLCNPIAAKCLRIGEKELGGQPLSAFFSSATVERILAAAATDRFFKEIGDRTYAMEVIPIMVHGVVAERLLYMDDLKDIQKTDRDFRRKIWAENGFLAKYTFAEYHSANREFNDFLSIAKSFARTEEPVVILGETGSGKEFLAQSMHNHSSRAGKAFVAVNCAAIPENLLESELFGYSDGAFTGARKGGKEGYFEMAHMGTIFLDEIAEMSSMLQSKLLRVIQEKQILRVGGNKLIPFNARVIVATNQNLWSLVQENRFRKDLYYRLSVLEIEVPPLRRRPEDVLALFGSFAGKIDPGMWETMSPLAESLESLLASYPWPGNVRELENFVHMLSAHWRQFNRRESALSLVSSLLERRLRRIGQAADLAAAPPRPPDSPSGFAVPAASAGLLRNSEERQIRETIANCRGSVIQAARILGIHRTTLWRKLKRIDGRD
jgi:propionate catabolism operon transcriptional regulator